MAEFIPLPISDVAEWDDDERLKRFPSGFPMTDGEAGRAVWDESKHPRQPKGSDHGGEFAFAPRTLFIAFAPELHKELKGTPLEERAKRMAEDAAPRPGYYGKAEGVGGLYIETPEEHAIVRDAVVKIEAKATQNNNDLVFRPARRLLAKELATPGRWEPEHLALMEEERKKNRRSVWDESKHPRQPSGSDKGGEFTLKGKLAPGFTLPEPYSGEEGDVRGALQSWVSFPSAMRIHMANELAGEPDPDNKGGWMMRSQARALLREVRENGRPNDVTLYRGADNIGNKLGLPESWSESRAVANRWGEGPGRRTFVLKKGEGSGIRVRDYVQSGIDQGEKQWLIDPASYPESLRSTWDESKHPRDPGGAHGGEWIKKGTVAADGEGSEGAVPGEGRGRPDVRFAEATPEDFLAAIRGNTRAWNLTEHTTEELATSQCFLSADGKTGITVSAEGDIQNAFRNPGGVKGSGSAAVGWAIEHGGITLDCYDPYLPGLYAQHGMVETGRMKFNPEYAPEGMPKGEAPDVVFMAINAKPGPVRYYDDWDEAKAAARRAARPKVRLDRAAHEAIEAEIMLRFDPSEPRRPKGDPQGGQWTRLGAAPGVIAPWKQIISAKSEFPASEVTMSNLTTEEAQTIGDYWTGKTEQSPALIEEHLGEVFDKAVADKTLVNGRTAFEEGEAWYQDVHDWAADQGKTHGLTPEMTAGVISALSPRMIWENNQQQARLFFEYYADDPERFRSMTPPDASEAAIAWAKAKGEKWPIGASKGNLYNAARILQGESPDAVLPQAKTRSFYNSILDPSNPIDVCIDTHMINAGYGGDTEGPAGLYLEVEEPPKAEAWGPLVVPKDTGGKTKMSLKGVTPRPPGRWFNGPKTRNQVVGVTPMFADATREITEEWNVAHPDHKLVPLQTQAIIWTEWLRMHPNGEKKIAISAIQDATIAAAVAKQGKAKRSDWWL